MGAPVMHIHDNRLVQFCCSGCTKMFTKEPAKYLEKLDKAVIEKQAKSYPLKECVVNKDALGDSPTQIILANRLIQTCCGGCAKKVNAQPAKYLALLDKANAASSEGESAVHKEEGSAKKK